MATDSDYDSVYEATRAAVREAQTGADSRTVRTRLLLTGAVLVLMVVIVVVMKRTLAFP